MNKTEQERLAEKYREQMQARRREIDARGPSRAKPRVWTDRAEDLVPWGSSRNVGDPIPVDPNRARQVKEFLEKLEKGKPSQD